MKNSPKVSIIVPVHNAGATIERCIKSIVCQNYNNIECILVENGSTDDSAEKCREYEKKYKIIQVEVTTSAGVSVARNLGLSIATGEIIGFCDADDFIEPGAIATIVSEFLKNPDIAGVISAFYIGRETTVGVQKYYRGLKRKKIDANEAIILTVGHDSVMGSVWNKYYRAKTLNGIWFDSELSYCEDTHFNVKALSTSLQNDKFMLIAEPLYCYMNNAQGVTQQTSKLFDEDGNLKYIVALKRILKDCNLNKKCKMVVKRRICELSIDYSVRKNISVLHRAKLLAELKANYIPWLLNINRCDLKNSLKRILKLIILIINSKGKKK